MASTYNKGQETLPVLQFEDYLEIFSEATNIQLLSKGDILEVRYELGGEKKAIYTRGVILLAACNYVREKFFKESCILLEEEVGEGDYEVHKGD